MSLYRGFLTVGGLTAVSRVFGFVRDVLLAAVMGTGWVADAFFVSFRFPNLFRALFAEGAFNSAFVPLFTKRLRAEGDARAREFAEEALSILLVGVTATVILAEIFMPYLVRAIAPGFSDDPKKFELAVLLTRITFPYLVCMSLVALAAGVLNAHQKFRAPAATPILLNLVLIAVTLFAAASGFRDQPEAGIIQAWGVAIAGFAQLLFVAWAARGLGMDLRFRLPRLTPDMRRLVKLAVPGLITGGINQVNIFIGTMIASLQASAVSFLYYADRVMQLPLGMVGIAIGVVLLPTLTRHLADADETAALASQNRSLEFALLLTLPASVALIVIPDPIIQVLFQRGSFTAEATRQVSLALAAYAAGLTAFVATKVFLPGFFAREDTATPMRFVAASVAVNIGGSLLMFPFIGHVGIAIATSLSGWTNALLLMITLMRRGHFRFDAALKRRAPRIVGASVAMGAALYGLEAALTPYFAGDRSTMTQAGAMLLLVTAGGAVYTAVIFASGAVRLSALRRVGRA
ncbi:murein biosynthesis integral membrane protein MurJ [Rhodomicrobium sp.]|uniref:murein biosynthesis integral membrane protein MurJ n=1 Tax=Rhodomicrobium sp. TaxID=2720632 RepID=UPI0039E4A1A5